jgi:hypothetical protein
MRYLVMLGLLLPCVAAAQEQRIGFVAGSTHGVGLGYSQQFKDGRGWQVSALPIVEDDLDATVFLGATMFQTLNSTTWGRAYWSLGMAAFYIRSTEERWDDDYENLEPVGLDEGVMLSFGPGVGLERRWKQFAVALELPLAVQLGYRNHEFQFLGLHPIPNFSLMYFW